MRTISTLLSRSAVAGVFALVGATAYIHLAEAHAQEQAASFCAAVQQGDAADLVRARADASTDKVSAATGNHGVAVMFGSSQRYVCDIRFAGGLVSAKAVTQLD